MNGRPWVSQYDPNVPQTLAPYPAHTLLDYVATAAAERPAHPALLFKGSAIGYAQLERKSNAFAAALVELGIRPGDRVALVLPNTPQFVIAELGAWKAGGIVLPLNPLYSEDELAGPLTSMGVETVVVLTSFYNRVRQVLPRTAVKRVIAANIKEYLPPLTRALFTALKERRDGHHVELAPGDFWFADLLRRHAHAPRPNVRVGRDDPAVILMSGGTTGTPKGVVGAHRSLVAAGLQLRAWFSSLLGEWDDIIMLPLPLFHVYGNVGVQSMAFIGRNPLSLVPNPRDIKDLLQTIREVRPNFFVGVPTLFNMLLNHPRVRSGDVDFRSMKLSFSGASALLAETRRRFEELTGGRITEGYSLTEAMISATIGPVLRGNRPGALGLPLPDVEMRIVDADTGEREMPVGEPGEIIIRAPQLMIGYWQNPAETAEVLRDHGDGGPWLHTGDRGYRDEDGYFYYVDRKKDLIKTSGYQVWPREVEEAVAAHPAVAEVAVAGVPDAAKGEIVQAWVVLRDGEQATESDIRTLCRDHLAPYKVPARVVFTSELPKTAAGKVLRRALVASQAG